jgi:hypothetical protein
MTWTPTPVRATPVACGHRDLWLVDALSVLKSVAGGHGMIVPPIITVSAGKTELSRNGAVWGECHPGTESTPPHIVISNELNRPLTVLEVLLHELIHAADNSAEEHGVWFKLWARELGLEVTRFPCTKPNRQLRRHLGMIAKNLGPYPKPYRTHVYKLLPSGQLGT